MLSLAHDLVGSQAGRPAAAPGGGGGGGGGGGHSASSLARARSLSLAHFLAKPLTLCPIFSSNNNIGQILNPELGQVWPIWLRMQIVRTLHSPPPLILLLHLHWPATLASR